MPVDPLHDASQDAEEAEIAAFEEAGRAAERAKAEASKASRYQPQSAAEHDGGILGIGLLADIELDATLQFGSCEMPLKEILELGPGDVVELDRHVSEPVDLVVGDLIVARGEVVVASGNFALRITEVATPQLRLESIRCQF
jgi:flagellar motor switch protein FliN/FliY